MTLACLPRIVRRFLGAGSFLLIAAGVVTYVGLGAEVPVARIGDHLVPASALRAAVARSGLPLDQPDTVRQAVRQLVDDEALAAEARRQGLDQDPEVVEQLQRWMIRKLVAREVDAVVDRVHATEAELREHHARNTARYATPAMARGQVATLLVRTNRAAVLRSATEAVVSARTNRFEDVVKRYSDFAQERLGGGDTGWLVDGVSSKKYPPEVLRTLLAIPQAGTVAEPVVTERAIYVVQLVEKRPGAVMSFEQVRPQVERDLASERRQQAYDALRERAREAFAISVDEAVVQQVIRENQSSSRPPAGPFRGGDR